MIEVVARAARVLHAWARGLPSPASAPTVAANGYLVNTLTGVDICVGTQMPKPLPPYTPEQIDMVSAWICQGAPP